MSISNDVEPSVEALRVQAEANRARLTHTVDELRTQMVDTASDIKERLSPAAIKAEVSDYVRDSRDKLWHSLERGARDNPLQAVALGALVALPAMKMLRAMPAPLLLVGAGLLLSRSTGSAASTIDQAASELRNRATAVTETVTGTVSEVKDTVLRTAHDARDYVRAGVNSLKESAGAAVTVVKDRVASGVEDASATVAGVAERTKDEAFGLAQQARSVVGNTWDQNPLLAAGVGLMLGAFMAAAFPSTKAEETVFGDANDALRRQAEGLAAKGVDAAKAKIASASAAATEEGLSVEGLTTLGESLTDKVRAVAERGLQTALGDTTKPETLKPMERGLS